jgi:hypothetical protein
VTAPECQDTNPAQLLTDLSEMLFRQVPPSWLEDGQPTSQAFAPTRKDNGKLSIARGSLTTAEASFTHYTTVLGFQSAGVWGFTVGEAQVAGLNSYDEPLPNIPEHGFVDFRGLTRNNASNKGKLLLAAARTRGRLHP